METAFKKYGTRTLGEDFVRLLDNSDKEDIKQIANGFYVEALKYYGILDSTNSFNGGLCLKNFNKEDYYEIFVLECLAYNYWWTTACLRRLYKGGNFVLNLAIQEKPPFYVYANPSLEYLMMNYDDRAKKYSENSTSSGIILNNERNQFSCNAVYPMYNVERLSINEYPQDKLFNYNVVSIFDEVIPNFKWGSIDLYYYYHTYKFAEKRFLEKYKYSFESYIGIIYILLLHNSMNSMRNPRAGMMMLQRAYAYYDSLEELEKVILQTYFAIKAELPFKLQEDEVPQILDDMLLPHVRTEISLATMGPQYPLISIEDCVIIDFYAIRNVLEYKMHSMESGKETKGHSFEYFVYERLTKSRFAMWKCMQELKGNDGTIKEIDISFIYKGYLFLGELKCHTQSSSYIKGDKQSLEFRRKKLTKALKQANEKARWIKNHCEGTNFLVPKDVHTIVPFVISPFVEYIWNIDDELWLTKDIPRICTPLECELLCDDKIIDEISDKPFLVKLGEYIAQ